MHGLPGTFIYMSYKLNNPKTVRIDIETADWPDFLLFLLTWKRRATIHDVPIAGFDCPIGEKVPSSSGKTAGSKPADGGSIPPGSEDRPSKA